ncbi:MAG: 2-octaprenyl-6-methoxyphenyl hydroxylase [Gammaproteobacteria bacterium]|nr:2-octaprenyl-6-methoxyphenyl hydroxylase [Gammaproteobacteria bacterium]
MAADYDLIIIGGGLAGASLACALAGSSLHIAVVEAIPASSDDQLSYDDRTTALAYSSRRIFEGIGVWRQIEQEGACPIHHILISDRGHFGFTRLHAVEAGLDALGYVATNRVMGRALSNVMQAANNIELLCPATIEQVKITADYASCSIRQRQQTRTISARLVVVAEGGRSGLREVLGIASKRKDYKQTAIVTNVTPGKSHDHVAYERFTETGPLALLPLQGQRCGVVWTTRQDHASTILSWDDQEFLQQLQQRFGNRLGKFERVGKRQSYPLFLNRVDEQTRERLVLIGNAAHAVHPVAGQGFNLGLRDVATLAQVLVEAVQHGDDIGALSVVRAYEEWRVRDNRIVSRFTDSLVRIFSNDFLPLVIGRNLGLLGVDFLPGLKREFSRRTSGLNGRLPRLARGLPLEPDHG